MIPSVDIDEVTVNHETVDDLVHQLRCRSSYGHIAESSNIVAMIIKYRNLGLGFNR